MAEFTDKAKELMEEAVKECDDTLNMRIPHNLKKLCTEAAKEKEMYMADFTRMALVFYLIYVKEMKNND